MAAASPFVRHDPAFDDVLGDAPRLALVAAVDAHEGPVYLPNEDALLFTTVPRRRTAAGPPQVAIKRLALDGERFPLGPERVSLVRADAHVANGMTLDGEGRLLVCEQGTRARPAAITRCEPSGAARETLVDGLNSPNDVVVARDGAVWFTDPSYGHLQGFRPPPARADQVLRLDPGTGGLTVVADSFDKPNGICFSPDETVLFVGDSGAIHAPGDFDPRRPHHVEAFDVVAGRRLEHRRVFAEIAPGFPDGIEVDSGGRIYVSSASGVQVFDPAGRRLGEIALPGAVNFCFGGARRNVLFITADTAVYAAVLAATGPPSAKGA